MVLRHLIAGLLIGLAIALGLSAAAHIDFIWLIVIGIVAANLGAIGSFLLDNLRPKQHGRKARALRDPVHHPKR